MRRKNKRRDKYLSYEKRKRLTSVKRQSYPSHVEGERTIGGKTYFFRSLWEMNYAYLLEWQKRKGEIANWYYEPTMFTFRGYKTPPFCYLPDFKVERYLQPYQWHEVKGLMTSQSLLKIRRFEKLFPEEGKILVFGPEFFVAGHNKYNGIVPGWTTLQEVLANQESEKQAHMR